MLVSELKPIGEILGSLRPGERVFVVACGGCAQTTGAGGEKAIQTLKSAVLEGEHPVVGALEIPFLCNKALIGLKLSRVRTTVDKAEVFVVASCGVGVQAVATVTGKPTVPASNTLYYGAFQGVWPAEERCARCGECVLAETGGICPLTVCPKGLLHGPCGGSYQGECELEPGRPCGWQKIYDRLAELGRLDLFEKFRPPKDRRRALDVPLSRRRTTLWDLEFWEE